ncbi:hypothetical protein BDB00DRAFT_802194 [Zychaea mexicana]|uniref:uncharacterized protein n=1 Tax=Zychaea mexicana TaxID=64656 RepID=UPI0022FE4CB4|nr:uncharacterized protein BDB00DRAFT_802194 [Zychaea mexicana]KAI9497854.1 hypothetical protein BDB00DRAFT_802194 [Zychaea mexicana]
MFVSSLSNTIIARPLVRESNCVYALPRLLLHHTGYRSPLFPLPPSQKSQLGDNLARILKRG